MYRIFLIKIILLCLLLSIMLEPAKTFAQQWNYIAIAHINENNSFYLFLDYSPIKQGSTDKQFSEKHSFNILRELPSGKQYKTVEITRIINCKDLRIADTEAYFKDENGDIIEHYSSNGEKRFKDINIEDNVDYEVFKRICKPNL